MPGGGTGNAVYVDLEKVVDKVPQKVAWYAFRKRGVTEYLVQNMLYSGFKTAVSVNSKLSDFFFAQVKVHQGSVLSPELLVIVIDALMGKYNKLKEALEGKGLCVNVIYIYIYVYIIYII